jgi:hypothetical protein
VTSGSRPGSWPAWSASRGLPTTRMIGLNLADLAVDGCITKAPCGGEVAGRSPVDRASRA